MSVQFPDLGIFPVYECFAAVLRRAASITADEAQWARALARLYAILRYASAGKCHGPHLATDRRARAGDSAPVRRTRGPAAGILPFAAAQGNLSLGAHMLSGGSVRRSLRADIADFGAWQAPRGEGPILPIEPCDGKSTRQRRSVSLCRSILWSGDRTCETPKS